MRERETTPTGRRCSAARCAPERAPGDDQRGFTLIGLMVVVAVINIGLAVAVTSWTIIDKRAKEAELIWRGRQYMRALRCHQQQEGGYPDALDELLESDCIRALYPDPMSRSGEWRIIRENDLRNEVGAGGARSAAGILDDIDREVRGPEAFFGGAGGGRGTLGGTGGLGARGAGGTGRSGAGLAPSRSPSTPDATSLQSAYQRLRDLTDRLRQDFDTGSGNGIVGVVSSSSDEALRLYEGETTYDAWRFLAR